MYLKFFIIKGKQIRTSERWEKKDKMQKSQKPGEKSFKNKSQFLQEGQDTDNADNKKQTLKVENTEFIILASSLKV